MSWADEHGMWRGRPAHEIAENPAAPAASTSGPGVPMRGIFAGNIKGLLMMAVHHRHTEAWSGGAATKLNLGSLLPKKAQELVTRCITQTIADPRPSKTVSLSIGMTLLFRGFSCLLVAECISRLTVARVAWATCPPFGQSGRRPGLAHVAWRASTGRMPVPGVWPIRDASSGGLGGSVRGG